MPAFEVVVVGSGGGPDETNLSAYLLKAHDARWKDGIIALEAGSGMGALNRLMRLDPTLFNDFHDATNEQDTESRGLSMVDGETRRRPTAYEVYSKIKCFLITHAHLDHISSLILSAGQLGCGTRRRVYAERSILKKLETAFEGKIWPKLASDDPKDGPHMLLYDSLDFSQDYRNVHPNISVRAFPLSHGETETGVYESSAFLFRHDITGSEFVLCGDLEPDKVAKSPQTINLWRAIAPNIASGTLSTIFIECSWPSGRPDSQLYGHLTPEHLQDELVALATQVVKHRQHFSMTVSTVSSIPTSLALPSSLPLSDPTPVPAPCESNADSITTAPSRSSSPTHSTRASLKRRASSFFSLLSPNKSHKRKSSEALNGHGNGNGNGNVSGSKGWSKKAKTDHSASSMPPQFSRSTTPAPTITTNGDSESVVNISAVPMTDPATSLTVDSMDAESIKGALQGLKIYVMHCKEDLEGQYPDRPIGHVIAGQVRELVESSGLGCEVLHADQGMRIVI